MSMWFPLRRCALNEQHAMHGWPMCDPLYVCMGEPRTAPIPEVHSGHTTDEEQPMPDDKPIDPRYCARCGKLQPRDGEEPDGLPSLHFTHCSLYVEPVDDTPAAEHEAPAWTLDDAAVKAGRAAASARIAARKIGAEMRKVADRQKLVNAWIADVVKAGGTPAEITKGLALARAEVLRLIALRQMREERRG